MQTTAANLKKAAKQIGIYSKDIYARTEAQTVKLPNGKTAREYTGSTLYFRRYYQLEEAVSIARQIANITDFGVHINLNYNSKRQVSISISTSNGTGIYIVDPYDTDHRGLARVQKVAL